MFTFATLHKQNICAILGAYIMSSRAASFADVIEDVIDNQKIPAQAKIVYITLLAYARRKLSATHNQIAKRVGLSERSVLNYLGDLERAGIIKVYRRGLGKSNLYLLIHAHREDDGSVRWRTALKPRFVKQTIPPSIRWQVWERDNFTCQSCGSRRNLEVDHITPESGGGPLTLENLQTLCDTCNVRKGGA